MTSSPAASAESTKPQAWRPIVSSATTGPRVKSAPLWIMFRPPNPSDDDPQPGDAAEERPALAEVLQRRGRLCPRRARGMLHGDQQERGESPGEGVDGERPAGADGDDEQGAEVGPSTVRPLRVRESSALACWSDSRGTSCGTMLAIAGIDIAGDRAVEGGQRDDHPELGMPGQHETGDGALRRAPRRRWRPAGPRRGGSGRTITPPQSSSTIIGMVCAARTWPSAIGRAVMSSTAKVSAMLAIMVPSVLTKREAKYHAKLRSPRGASAPSRLIGAPRWQASSGRPRR